MTQANAFLGEKLQVNQAQKDANFVLSVPEAILAANEMSARLQKLILFV